MANHKLQIDDFEEVEYCLIAILTPLEDYRLAYFINKNLPILFSKNKNGVQIKTKFGESLFSRFDFNDKKKDVFWCLIQNQNQIVVEEVTNSLDLFANTIQKTIRKVFLLPEFKKANYLLKIETSENKFDLEKTISVLKTIDQISKVYKIEIDNIKNKNNLIF